MATWASVKAQAETKLGLQLVDKDVLDIPMLATDPYGNFIPGPRAGCRSTCLKDGTMVEGNIASPGPGARQRRHFDTPFLTDIAHNADPEPAATRTTTRRPRRSTPAPDAGHTSHRPISPTSRPARTTTSCSTRTSPPVTAASTRTSR